MEKQANSRLCFVCGLENPVGLHLNFYEAGPGEVTVNFTPSEHYQGYPGLLHGGIVASVLDEAAGRAHMGIFPPRFMFTAKLEVKYRKNIPIGKPLKIIGKAGKGRGRMAEGWSGIYNQEGELLAEANALLVDVPNPPDPSELQESGWKVYPD
ncbi:MAG: PaaI family thioesterase [Chloroflexi bacterium]|nr:PaaI family thioesterase [Chloroflexota bacterium]